MDSRVAIHQRAAFGHDEWNFIRRSVTSSATKVRSHRDEDWRYLAIIDRCHTLTGAVCEKNTIRLSVRFTDVHLNGHL